MPTTSTSVRRSRGVSLVFLSLAWLGLSCGLTWAEAGVLVIHVKDVQRRPVSGLQIGVEGDGGSSITGDDGKARVALAKATKEKSWVSLQILKSPLHNDFVMVSPWDYRTLVPPFENESENFVEVVVVRRGDRTALENGTVVAAAAAQINKANAPKIVAKQAPPEDPKANLVAIAEQYGLAPDDLDQAIRAWGVKATDPYEAGLAALYERNYREASVVLADSLQKREEKLAADQKALAEAAFLLNHSPHEQGDYRDSTTAHLRCLQLFDDSATLNKLAVRFVYADNRAGAELLFRRASLMARTTLGPNHFTAVTELNNLTVDLAADQKAVADAAFFLGQSLYEQGKYRDSATAYQRCLQLRPDDTTVLNELAISFYFAGDDAGAEPLLRRALDINEKALGPDDPDVAKNLNGLAELLRAKGDYAGAEPLDRRALAIFENALGPDNPDVAAGLNNLATVLYAKRDYAGAEPLYRRALDIDEKALGPNHPAVAANLVNLAALLEDKGDTAGAEPLLRRALAINEKALGPDHPEVATDLNNLALLLTAKGDYAEAEPLYRQSLAIGEKALGPDHPQIAAFLYNLAQLLEKKGDYPGAEPLLRRALAIDEKTLGPDHPTTDMILLDEQAVEFANRKSSKRTKKSRD